MVTWAEVTRWEPAPLQNAVGAVNAEYNKLVPASEDLRKLTTPYGWIGQAAEAAANRVTQIVDRLEAWAAELEAARTAATNVGDAVAGVRRGADEAVHLATAHNFTIADDGAVHDNGPIPQPPRNRQRPSRTNAGPCSPNWPTASGRSCSAPRTWTTTSAPCWTACSSTIYDSTTNDNSATSLAAAGALGIQAGGLTIPPPPADGATAAQNATYWATLSDQQRKQLALDHPHLVGPRDGFTTEHRDIANRVLLNQQRTKLQKDIEGVQAELGGLTNGPGHDNSRYVLQCQIDDLQGKLSGLNEIQARLDTNPGLPEDRRYYLLGIDRRRKSDRRDRQSRYRAERRHLRPGNGHGSGDHRQHARQVGRDAPRCRQDGRRAQFGDLLAGL